MHATVSAVNDSQSLVPLPASLAAFASRSGWANVTVTDEPSTFLCPILRADVPLDGNLNFSGTCLSDGLYSTLNAVLLG